MAPSARACPHDALQVDVSTFAAEAKYMRPDLRKRVSATTSSGRLPPDYSKQNDHDDLDRTFPGPLVLPGDDLAIDPKYPAQSFRSWIQEKDRNEVTDARKTIYIGATPEVAADLSFMKSWTRPTITSKKPNASQHATSLGEPNPPKVGDVHQYLEAFYHGMPVKLLPRRFSFIKWDKRASKTPSHVGLQYGTSCTRVRTRPCPDRVFDRQLNLNDILDAEIEMLPEDAYAVLLLVDHDLYEDEDDDFCCGRAYGGSRISVVSSARYHPALDESGGVDHEHMWPASHCRAYIEGLYPAKPAKRQKASPEDQSGAETSDLSPLRAAIISSAKAPPPSTDLDRLWLSRIVRTASHELGHCLALDHCVYYACVMQGTAGMAEDVRQPPYLCPVCLKKVARAVLDYQTKEEEKQYVTERYAALSRVCEQWKHVGMFGGLLAWTEAIQGQGRP